MLWFPRERNSRPSLSLGRVSSENRTDLISEEIPNMDNSKNGPPSKQIPLIRMALPTYRVHYHWAGVHTGFSVRGWILTKIEAK